MPAAFVPVVCVIAMTFLSFLFFSFLFLLLPPNDHTCGFLSAYYIHTLPYNAATEVKKNQRSLGHIPVFL